MTVPVEALKPKRGFEVPSGAALTIDPCTKDEPDLLIESGKAPGRPALTTELRDSGKVAVL